MFTLSTSTASFAQRAPRAGARASSRNCVHFNRQEHPERQSIEFEVDNQCPIPVVATVTWSVGCEAGIPDTPRDHQESLRPGERRVLVATAPACEANRWVIEGVRWSWHRAAEER
jgi:hypothetical protein